MQSASRCYFLPPDDTIHNTDLKEFNKKSAPFFSLLGIKNVQHKRGFEHFFLCRVAVTLAYEISGVFCMCKSKLQAKVYFIQSHRERCFKLQEMENGMQV